MTLISGVNATSSEPTPRPTSPPVRLRRSANGVTRFWFKACPRCRGDLVYAADIDEPYISCMQCGHYPATI